MAFTGRNKMWGTDYTLFYVSHAVGTNADNWWTDIMLVQYFIRNIYQMNSVEGAINVWNMTTATRNDLGDLPDPHRDFKALKKTAKWIRHFQSDAILVNGYSLMADGRVDPFSGLGDGMGLNSKMQTIHYLNIVYQNSMANLGIDDWYSWTMGDPGLPQMVKSQLIANDYSAA